MEENTEKKEMGKVYKALGKTVRKVGFTTYELLEDAVASQASALRRQRTVQNRHNLYQYTDEELVNMARESSASDKIVIQKELAERHSEEYESKVSFWEGYGTVDRREYEGFFVDENEDFCLQVLCCSDRELRFIFNKLEGDEKVKGKEGKGVFFLNTDTVLCTGWGYTFRLIWNDRYSFEIKGKIPWKKEDVDLSFSRVRIAE